MRCGVRRGEKVYDAYDAAMVARRSGGVEPGRTRTKRRGPTPHSAPWGEAFVARCKGLRWRVLQNRKILNYETQVYEKPYFSLYGGRFEAHRRGQNFCIQESPAD